MIKRKIYYGKNCKKCNGKIEIDEVDYYFKGTEDEYLYCKNCNEIIIAKVRYGNITKIDRIKFTMEDFEK